MAFGCAEGTAQENVGIVGTDVSRPCQRFDCKQGRDTSVPTRYTVTAIRGICWRWAGGGHVQRREA